MHIISIKYLATRAICAGHLASFLYNNAIYMTDHLEKTETFEPKGIPPCKLVLKTFSYSISSPLADTE